MALKKIYKSLIFLIGLSLIYSGLYSNIGNYNYAYVFQLPDSTVNEDSIKAAQDSLYQGPYKASKTPTYQPADRHGDPFSSFQSPSPLILNDPSSFQLETEIDTGMNYTIYETIGEDLNYRPTTEMSFEEFSELQERRMLKDYWKTRSAGLDGESAVSGRRLIPPIYVSPLFDRIFGGSYVDIQPTGFVTLDFGGRWQRIANPAIPIRQQRNGGFEFDQQISMNVVGKIGEKLAITANFDNNNSFDFENDLRVEYTGYEEEIIKKIEIGNVSLPVSNSLMTGAQSLFGVKTQLQFGKLFVTGVASTQRGKSDVIEVEAGSQGKEFNIRASEYDENRHFFLGHFFKENFDIERWLRNIPQITSGVNITRLEVYVLNRNMNTETVRGFIGFMDLAEDQEDIFLQGNPNLLPAQPNFPNSNEANNLYDQIRGRQDLRNVDNADQVLQNQFDMEKGRDYEIVAQARKLDAKEYTFNPQLGYLSLFRKLQNDEVLAVSYEYTYNGRRYRVGELTEDYADRPETDLIFLKMLRPQKINTAVPTWDLMMKNVYNLNASQVAREGFELRVQYRDDNTGIDNPSLHEGAIKNVQLVEVMGLDRLNQNLDFQPDGNFDFIEGITILPENGQIIFPVKEPFGSHLRSKFAPGEDFLKQKYVYDTLYNTTQADAELVTTQNKFFIVGRYQAGSSRDIALPGINISENSVRVFAGSLPLTEGVDYRVDYNLGRVSIINEGILNSGKRIRIEFEKADLFSFQTRSLLGTRLDYRFNDNFNIGATALYVNERPLVSRINIGDEPTRNFKYGFDINYRGESRFLTKMIDALPLVSTKEKSTINFNAEFAQLKPGTSNQVKGASTSYIDDFEAAVIPFSLGNGIQQWKLAATPKTDDNRYHDGLYEPNSLQLGYKRAKLAWYTIDNIFYVNQSINRDRPDIDDEARNYTSVMGFTPFDLFPGRDQEVLITNEPTFDLAFFPHERGQYNYNPDLDEMNGVPLLKNPEENWGGITRAITSDVDFDKNNVEFIEFWMMDPFHPGEYGRVLDGIFDTRNNSGGELIFHLGSVSEDVIKDSRHGFENGLPTDADNNDVPEFRETPWGRVTTEQFLTDGFDLNNRDQQDVGMDGLDDEAERNYAEYPEAVRQLPDPSADNFQYYLGPEADQLNGILQRYKNFNGMDGNSPSSSGNERFTPSGSVLPDNEDLNRDNTISDLEEYYEYRLNIRPGELEIGKNHIVDKVSVRKENLDQDVDWYLFRIPIRRPDRVQGDISGFKSIRYIRTILTGYESPVVLRFAKFQLLGSQWRKYLEDLGDGGLAPIPEINQEDFAISVVNYEENGPASGEQGREYIYNYPPGINPDRDITSPIVNVQNEQSIQLCVDDLPDAESRAMFKNITLDLVNYGRLKMFLHAHSEETLDGEVTAFIRLGTDFTENYYEIELPLVMSPRGNVSREEIWPGENEIDLPLEALHSLKSKRNRVTGRYSNNNTDGLDLPFIEQYGKYTLKVEGNPDLSSVQTLMIGVRNPHTEDDDQLPKSVCIWANELRVADFDNFPGYAANARLSTQLADFANISTSMRYSTVGFGGVQQRIAERSREEIQEFDVAANITVDKLLPESFGLKIPMYVSYETGRIIPQFDPRDPDIPLSAALASFGSSEERLNYRKIVEERVTRRSINFTNVRKVKTKEDAKSNFFDIENFAFSYAYSDMVETGFYRANYLFKSYRGNVTYNFTPEPVVLEPFKKMKIFKSPWLALIKDFNISLLPTSVNLRADLDRRFIKTQLRNQDLTTDGIAPNYEKYFTFNRSYNLRWNFTKNLSFDYMARANAIIDEPQGDIDLEWKRDSIWTNIKRLGRMKNFNQQLNFNYRIPFDKIPITDWISGDAQYSVGYTWTAGTLNQTDSAGNFFGHTIQNNREQGISGKVDFVKLYNKIKFLEEINRPTRRRPSRRPPTRRESADSVEQKPDLKFLKRTLRTLMALRSVNITYGRREGTILPGFTKDPSLFGMDSSFNSPGWAFVLGSQSPDIKKMAAENNWLTASSFLTSPFTQISSVDLNIRGTIEPFKDLRIQVDMKKTKAETYQEIFRFDPNASLDTLNGYRSLTPSRTGSYMISYLPIRTSFLGSGPNNQSEAFENFNRYRAIIKDRLDNINPNGEYQNKAQDVLIPAFLAAYSGADPRKIKLSPFPNIPLPNWRIDYKGLNNIPGMKDIFSSINLTHSYSSSFQVNGFTSALDYTTPGQLQLSNSLEDYPLASQINADNELIPLFIMNQVVISERFSPLIGLNFTTKNRINARIEYRRERNVALNMMNSQVTELNNSDFAFSFGFTKANLKLPFKVQGETVVLENELTFKADFTIRDTRTLQRKIVESDTIPEPFTKNEITSGNLNIVFRPTVSYVLNQRLNLTFYIERNINEPRITNSFARRTSAFGVQVRFSLAQ